MNGYQEIQTEAASLALVHLCKRCRIFIYMSAALPETKHKSFTKHLKTILERKKKKKNLSGKWRCFSLSINMWFMSWTQNLAQFLVFSKALKRSVIE